MSEQNMSGFDAAAVAQGINDETIKLERHGPNTSSDEFSIAFVAASEGPATVSGDDALRLMNIPAVGYTTPIDVAEMQRLSQFPECTNRDEVRAVLEHM